MNPTVSLRRKGTFSITTFLTVVSSVANSLFSAKTSLLARRFIKVLLPTLVYPTREIRTKEPLFPRCEAICLSTFFPRWFMSFISLGDNEKKAISDADTKPDANNKSTANDMATIASTEGGIMVTPSNNSVKRHKVITPSNHSTKSFCIQWHTAICEG